MNKVLLVFSLCVLFVFSVSQVDGKRSGSRKPSTSNTSNNRRHQDNRSRNNTSGGSHGGSNQHFLDSERHDTNNRGHIGFEKYNPSQSNPGGFGQGNYRPSAPPAGGTNQGIGSAFGGANYPPKTQNTHVQSAPYPTNNNPGGFGSNPAGGTHYNQPGGFNSNPGGFGSNPAGGTHYNQPGGFNSNPGGFGSNPAGGTHYNQPGGFNSNPGGFGSNPAGGTHYNQPGGQYNQPGGFGQPGHYNQPGGIGQPAGGHYNQPGGFGQPNYGGTHGSQYPAGNPYGGGQPHYPVGGYGHQPNYPGSYNGGHGYNPGGYGGYNPGGFGGGNPGGFGHGGYGGYPQGGGFSGGNYKTNSGPGFGTGLLGGAAGALPLGLLVGYGLGSMSSSPFSSHSSPASPAAPAAPGAAAAPAAPAPGANEAYNLWLQQRTEEKKQELAKSGDVVGINQTQIVNQILNETQMCPGGAGILDASVINTMVPCNVTNVDFNIVNVTEPVQDDCKSLTLSVVQINTATNENKTVTIQVKQNNITGSNEFVILSYDVELVACTTPLNNPDGKLCATRSFTGDRYHTLNETMTYLHTTNISITQFNTTLNNNCSATGACGPDSKPSRNLTSTFINLSILPEYPLNIMLDQCMIFKTNTCDPTSTTPCDAPLVTSLQTIRTNTSLSKTHFAYINFVLHESVDVFTAFAQQQQSAPPPAENPGSSSSLTDTTTKSSATTI